MVRKCFTIIIMLMIITGCQFGKFARQQEKNINSSNIIKETGDRKSYLQNETESDKSFPILPSFQLYQKNKNFC